MQVIATMRSPPHSSVIEEVVALLTQLGNRDDPEEVETGKKRSRQEAGINNKVSAPPHSDSRRSSIVSGGGSDNLDHVYNVIVAVRQENIFATAFHPELTDDLRWHRLAYIDYTYFL